MAIFIAINVLGTVSPIKVSSLMQSALIGLFWPYFSTRINLTFQGLRVGWGLVAAVRYAPNIINIMRIQSIAGLAVFDWTYGEFGGEIDFRATQLLEALARAEMGLNFWIFIAGLLIIVYSMPYLFYRYFKAIGVFRRLPSF